MSGGIRVTFHGVRGSTPCEGPDVARYGGHSSCVVLEADDESPLVLDLGTGLRRWGGQLVGESNGAPVHASALLTHLHWDHVQGLPFFLPLHDPESTLDVYGPRQEVGSLGSTFSELMRPPFFPIRPEQLDGEVRFHDTGDDDFAIGPAKVRSRWVRHVGPTLGFRVEWNGVVVTYISDHGPGWSTDHSDEYVPDEILELCDGADLLVHDAQHTTEEWEPKRHWGHCTVDYAVQVARESGARSLALFHHDPSHGDDMIDRITRMAGDRAASCGAGEILAAAEGLVVDLHANGPRR